MPIKLFVTDEYLKPVCKQISSGLFKILLTKNFLQIIYKYIFINRNWHQITFNGWYAIKPNQPNLSKQEYILWEQLNKVPLILDKYKIIIIENFSLFIVDQLNGLVSYKFYILQYKNEYLDLFTTKELDWVIEEDHHHHHVVLVARISLTLCRHLSLSFIASGRSFGQHPVSSHSCWMYVRAGHPAFARPCVGVHKSTSLMSLSLLLQQCPACLVRLTWIVFVIGGRWPYSSCLVGCCRQDLF